MSNNFDEQFIAIENELNGRNPKKKNSLVEEYEDIPNISNPLIKIGTNSESVNSRQFYNGKVIIRIPNNMQPMKEELVSIKYPMERRPQIILSSSDTKICLGLSFLDVEFEGTMEESVNWMVSLIKRANANNRILNQGVEIINDKEVGFLELMSQAIDTKIYNIMFFTPVEDKLLNGSFNCTKDIIDIWKPLGKAIIKSMKFEEKRMNINEYDSRKK